MSGYWLDVALIAVLMLVNEVFAGSEIALISLRRHTGGQAYHRIPR
jgi:putative hemolysin